MCIRDRMYVVPMDVGGKVTVGIMSAFFDDCDEPLVIYTTPVSYTHLTLPTSDLV